MLSRSSIPQGVQLPTAIYLRAPSRKGTWDPHFLGAGLCAAALPAERGRMGPGAGAQCNGARGKQHSGSVAVRDGDRDVDGEGDRGQRQGWGQGQGATCPHLDPTGQLNRRGDTSDPSVF